MGPGTSPREAYGDELGGESGDRHRLLPIPRVPRRLVLSAAGPGMRRVLHELAAPTYDRFAARWGYELHLVDLPRDGTGADIAAQAAKWAKIGLLRDALRSYDTVLWLDADVVLTRADEDVARHLRDDDFQGLVLEQVPAEHRVNPNTGVWLLRGARAVEFLDVVERLGPQPGPWSDQGAVLAALGWDRGDACYRWARPGRGSPYLQGTSWLPTAWNQPYLGPREAAESFNSTADSYVGRPSVAHPHAVHFMGLTPAARLRLMAELLDQLYDAAV